MANAQQQPNGLPFRNAQFRNPSNYSFPTRTNVPPQLSSFGYMLAMDEDLPSSLVSPSAPDSPPAVTGQMRPTSASGQSPTTLTLRPNNHNWQGPSIHLPSPGRLPQRTPSLGSASDASTSTSASSSASEMSPSSTSESNVKRKDVDGDCSICWEAFEKEQNELLWCKLTCGNNFHKKCFVEWLVTPKHQRTTPDLKCPYCRGDWDPAELRTLQIENGIIPPRPYKRPRPDHPAARGLAREHMRRHYRERRQQLQREYQSSLTRAGGADRYRPNYDSAVPPQQSSTPSYVGYVSPPSMRSTPGAPPSTPQASPPTSRQTYPQFYPTPMASQWGPRQPQLPSQYGVYPPPYQVQSQVMPTMTPMTQSHDLTAPGYNVPTFAPNGFLPPMTVPHQQPMQGPSQRQVTRCPAMQTQQISSVVPSPHGMTMPTSPYFCPGMAHASYELQINYQWQANYNYTAPSFHDHVSR